MKAQVEESSTSHTIEATMQQTQLYYGERKIFVECKVIHSYQKKQSFRRRRNHDAEDQDREVHRSIVLQKPSVSTIRDIKVYHYDAEATSTANSYILPEWTILFYKQYFQPSILS
ncbi:hypothetical protein C0J52_25110 [Blattella germanica]|nr:hypothetical protein C0J52_25110 [Blattella germanica]